jgi:hypothetical protein
MNLDTTISGASSDSYITLLEFETYAMSMGWDVTCAGDDVNEANLRRAAAYIDRAYKFPGYKTVEAQARQWPRVSTLYVDGWYLASDAVPQRIKDAQAELAWLILGGLDPFATVTGVVGSKRSKAGPVEVETSYIGGVGRPNIVALTGLLSPLLSSGGSGQIRMGRG